MDYSEIKLLLSTYSYCKGDAKNCNECPWIKNKGNCVIDKAEWDLKLYEVCSELFETVENLHADISALQEDNSLLEQDNDYFTEENKRLGIANQSYRSKLDISIELNENLRRALMAYKDVGKDQALAIYRKDVYIAELKARLKTLSPEEEV